mgnify:CR=1 FL=1
MRLRFSSFLFRFSTLCLFARISSAFFWIPATPMPEIRLTDSADAAHTEYWGQPTPARAKLAFFRMENISIELIEPAGGPSTWQEFLDAKGEGVHHIAFRIEDMDGNRYIDYVGSWGPMIAGHAHPDIVAAVREAAGAAIKQAQKVGAATVATIIHGGGIGGLDLAEAAQAVVEGSLLAVYKYDALRSKKEEEEEYDRAVDSLTLVEFDESKNARKWVEINPPGPDVAAIREAAKLIK